MKILGLSIFRFFMISARTLGVAVAVSAMIGISCSSSVIMFLILRYSGRKSWPHSDIQCASSTAMKDILMALKNSMVSSFPNVSGAT